MLSQVCCTHSLKPRQFFSLRKEVLEAVLFMTVFLKLQRALQKNGQYFLNKIIK